MNQMTLDLETARLIRKVFLPANPRRCKVYHPDTMAAVQRYLEALERAERSSKEMQS